MTVLKCFALLATVELATILMLTWLGILPTPVFVFFASMVAIPCFSMMLPGLGAMFREILSGDD